MGETSPPLGGWRDLAEAVPAVDGVQSGDEFVYISESWAASLGVDADALVDEHWSKPLDREGVERLEEGIERAREDGQWEGEARTGGENIAGATVDLTLSSTGHGAIVWQVTGSDRGGNDGQYADDGRGEVDYGRLPEGSSRRYRRLIEAAPVPIWVMGEEEILYLNGAATEFFGADDPGEVVGHSDREFVVPGERDRSRERNRQIIENDEILPVMEGRKVGLDGEIRHGLFAGAPIQFDGRDAILVIARDITERKEREGELERYETIVETIGDGVYALDEELQFSFVNDAICEMIGTTRKELLGTRVTELFASDEEREVARELRSHVVEGDTNTGTIQATVPTPYGERTFEARYRLYPEVEGEFRGSVGVLRDVTEREERERELRAARRFNEELVENAPFGMFRLDEDLRITYENPRAKEIIGLPDEKEESAAIGIDIRELPSIVETGQAEMFSRLQEGETIEFEFSFESIYGKEAYFTGRGVPLYRDGEFDGAVLMANDISERRRRERELERQHDELATLDRINDLLLETVKELVETSSRDAVERSVCERLAASELYQFAWVGERELDGDRIVPRTSAGEDHGYLDAITITDDDTETGQGPAGSAMRTGEVQVANVDDPEFDPWREAATERGVESVAAVPLRHGETVYGVLAVYATREDAFSEREQAGFDVLGRTVGFVIHAARSRELLFADAVVELEFRIGDDPAIVQTARELGCEFSLDGYVPADEGWIQYFTVTGVQPGTAVEAMGDDSPVERARVVTERSDGGRIELVVTESTLLHTMTSAGATVRTAGADPDGGWIVVEAPVDIDVREVVNHVQSAYPGAELVARREHDREVATVGRPGGLLGDLTDRQREVLEAAYRAGYFAWPRESTAEDVAESLDLTPPTLHGHLRKAEETILSSLLDGE